MTAISITHSSTRSTVSGLQRCHSFRPLCHLDSITLIHRSRHFEQETHSLCIVSIIVFFGRWCNTPRLKRSTSTAFGFLPHLFLHTSTWAPILPLPVAAFVLGSKISLGMKISPILTCKKWLTIYINPSPFDPDGRSRLHDEKSGSVFSNGVSKKQWNSSRMYGTQFVSALQSFIV